MGFLGNLVSGVVKVAVAPLAVVADVASIVTGDDNPKATKGLLKSAGEDFEDSADDLADGELM